MKNAILAVAVTLLGAAACAGSNQGARGSARSLYERLGGKEAITAVVNNFIGRVGQDERINARFANSDLAHLKLMLVDQICEASGGPCKYTGKDMRTAHIGMKIADDEFNALVEDLQGAMTELKVGQKEQNDLVGALAPMRPDVVGL
jgi:hemoglobin